MLSRIAQPLFRRVPARILGLSVLVGLSLLPVNQLYRTAQPPKSPPPSLSHPQQWPQLPENQSYYLVAYDPEQKQMLQALQQLLADQKQRIITYEKKQYQQAFKQQLYQPISVFYKGKHLPYRIKLDISKGDIISQSTNIEEFVSEIGPEQLQGLMKSARNNFNNPLMVVNVYSQQGYKMLRSQILALTQLHILNPLYNRVYIIRNAGEKKQNTYHILRNDILAQMEETPQQLETFKHPEDFDEKTLQKARVEFIEFLLPRIHTIREFEDFSLYQQKASMDEDKYTVSVNISPHDKLSQQKLKVLHQLYRRYHSNFNFVIFATSKFKSMYVHTTKQSEDFTIFNAKKSIPSNIQQRNTYSKLFLGDYDPAQSLETNLQRVTGLVGRFLNKEVEANDLNVIPTEKHFQINLTILKKLLNNNKGRPFVLGVCPKKCRNSQKAKSMDYWIDSSVHNIGLPAQVYLKVDPSNKVVQENI